MKTRLTSLALVMSLLFLVPLQIAKAQDNSRQNNLSNSSNNNSSSTLRYSLPITGSFTDQSGALGTFSGTLNIHRFAVNSGRLNVIGTVSGSLTDSLGKVLVTTVQTVSLPVTFPSAITPTSQAVPERTVTFSKASYSSANGLAATTVALPQVGPCNILNLSIGTIDLNVLGLTVHLNPILLVINAVPGAGNLLGNLLCAVTNLLNGVGSLVQIAQLLNQILAILSALGG